MERARPAHQWVLLVENLTGKSQARGWARAVITITGNQTEERISGSLRAQKREIETQKLTTTTNSPFSLAIIISVGDHAAYICISQLDIKIPLYPVQFPAVTSHLLSHYICYMQDADSNTKLKRRVVIVAFCNVRILIYIDN